MVNKQQAAPVFRAADGTEFKDEAAAERYEDMLLAKESYKRQREIFQCKLAETQTTACGQPFSFDNWGSHLVLRDYIGGLPHLDRVQIWPTSVYDIEEDGTVRLLVLRESHDDKRVRHFERLVEIVRIDQIYFDESKARIDLSSALEKRAKELKNEAKKLTKLA